jgi:hypothetical protein
VKADPTLSKARRIIDQWVLLEYCCCWLPVNPQAVVDAVSKSVVTPQTLAYFGIEMPVIQTPPPKPDPIDEILAKAKFTPLDEVKKAVDRAFGGIDHKAMADKIVKERLDKLLGRI